MSKQQRDTRYPIYYNGKKYTKKNVHDVFDQFYTGKDSLGALGYPGGVYMTEGMVIFPNGKIVHDR